MMDYFLPFIIGFIAAFVGLIPPAMLNMTGAKISIEKGRIEGTMFAIGASLIVFVQGFIAVYFAKVITEDMIVNLTIAAIFVLFALAIFFFIQARKKFNVKGKDKKGSSFLNGLIMASLNMMAIPFYLAMAKVGEGYGMILEIPYSLTYVIGAMLGAFSVFYIYVIFAQVIAKKALFIAQNINYILSALFVVLGIVLLIKVF